VYLHATPCDFFLWGYVKDQVYVPPLPASIPELKVRIRTAIDTITADMLQTAWNELDYNDIFVNCNWVVTRWQKYSTHLHKQYIERYKTKNT